MTDHEINRAVAEARGWKPIDMGGAGEGWEKPNGGIGALPRVCTDPAAWGALFEELAQKGLNPELAAVGDKHRASVGKRMRGIRPLEASPGRALALAFLKAVGR
jgi:hypothetical protein